MLVFHSNPASLETEEVKALAASGSVDLFIYDNRIEIISPGHLPNNLTVEKIRAGNANIRNPILVSYAAKGLLPYHGLGSGIKRALSAWSDIEFQDDHEGCLFTVTIYRKPLKELNRSNGSKMKQEEKWMPEEEDSQGPQA